MEAFVAFLLIPLYETIVIEARIAITTTTISNSTIVKPCLGFEYFDIFDMLLSIVVYTMNHEHDERNTQHSVS